MNGNPLPSPRVAAVQTRTQRETANTIPWTIILLALPFLGTPVSQLPRTPTADNMLTILDRLA